MTGLRAAGRYTVRLSTRGQDRPEGPCTYTRCSLVMGAGEAACRALEVFPLLITTNMLSYLSYAPSVLGLLVASNTTASTGDSTMKH